MELTVGVIGQGYVGLPISMSASKCGYRVIGFDIDLSKIALLSAGRSTVTDISDSQVRSAIDSNNYRVTADFKLIKECDVILVCVPTPLGDRRLPDLKFLISALESVSRNIKKNALIIIESTIEPGTTRNIIFPLICDYSSLSSDEFFLAFSPERIDPANKKWIVNNTPKLVSGITKEASIKAIDFYSRFIDPIVECSSLEVAETAKLLENSFRLINISFINEISKFCQKMGIDVNQVINAAATKPYGFMPFYPSIGVGGHCIPVDPLYLSNKAREVGVPTRFIDLADEINQEMPEYFVGRAEEKLGELNAKKVLVIGVSYKPNVADVRETPVESLITGLKLKGAQVSWHDDLVKEWNGEKPVTLSSDFDLAIIATPHDYLDLTKLGDAPILNTRGSI
jgi:UDP-N-acetyl-D-glucosamine dehydrogenase